MSLPTESTGDDLITVRRDCVGPAWLVDALKDEVRKLQDEALDREVYILFLQSQLNGGENP